MRGDFDPDWPSPVKAMLGLEASDLRGWYQRRDGDENIFFVVEGNGRSAFYRVKNGQIMVFDPVTGGRGFVPSSVSTKRDPPATGTQITLKPVADYPVRLQISGVSRMRVTSCRMLGPAAALPSEWRWFRHGTTRLSRMPSSPKRIAGHGRCLVRKPTRNIMTPDSSALSSLS